MQSLLKDEKTPTVETAILIAMTKIDDGANADLRRLARVDGCPADWIVALATEYERSHRLEIRPTIRGVLDLVGDSGIVVVRACTRSAARKRRFGVKLEA